MSSNPETLAKRQRLICDDKFLAGFRLFIHPAAIGRPRKEMLIGKIRINGGEVVDNVCEMTGGNFKNFILLNVKGISPDMLAKTVAKIAADKSSLSSVLVDIEWLTECLKASRLVNPEHYVLSSRNGKDDEAVPQMESKSCVSKFVCSQASGTKSLESSNQRIIEELAKLAEAYKSTNDKWRAFGYEKAIAAIKRHTGAIVDYKDAETIPGLGKKMAAKIAEILEDGTLQKAREVCNNDKVKTVNLFTKIWGVGPTTAESFYLQGFRSLADLAEKASLTRQQKIGLDLFEDLDERMHRSEAEEIFEFVNERASKLRPGVEVIACGSFRRGKSTCGDIDLLITHTCNQMLKGLFQEVISDLETIGFLTHHLSTQSEGRQQKYLGVCKLPGLKRKHRRIDIIVAPFEEKATALLYFTGSAHFNRSMRLLAVKKGMSLSEHALLVNVVRAGHEKLSDGQKLDTPTEESVFAILGIPFRAPHERDH